MDFFEKTGKMAIGSRLRILTDRITADDSLIYEAYRVDTKPKWFPVILMLSDGETKTITGIAKEIGHSHPSVSNIVKEMTAKGLVREVADKTDKRRTAVTLTKKGLRTAEQIKELCKDVSAAVDGIFREATYDLWRAIVEWEELLDKKTLVQRVKEARKERESQYIEILPYEPRFRQTFYELNKEWITRYFEIEEADLRAMEHPQEYILDKGGFIFVGCYKGEPVGVCALLKRDDPVYPYELAKLAVSPKAQGLGIGVKLCQAVVDKARELGAAKLFLESNTRLHPAIHIYRKVGFKELPHRHSEYKRADIWMEADLQNDNNM